MAVYGSHNGLLWWQTSIATIW